MRKLVIYLSVFLCLIIHLCNASKIKDENEVDRTAIVNGLREARLLMQNKSIQAGRVSISKKTVEETYCENLEIKNQASGLNIAYEENGLGLFKASLEDIFNGTSFEFSSDVYYQDLETIFAEDQTDFNSRDKKNHGRSSEWRCREFSEN